MLETVATDLFSSFILQFLCFFPDHCQNVLILRKCSYATICRHHMQISAFWAQQELALHQLVMQ